MTSDNLGNFLTLVTTFHDLRTTLMTDGDEILTTLKTIGEDTLMTPVGTHDHFVTTLNDVTDNLCDDIDDQEQVARSNRYQGSLWGSYQVTTMTTR